MKWAYPLLPFIAQAAFDNANGVELSCYLSHVPDSESFCFMVDWRTARAYDKKNYNVYEPKNELQSHEQDQYARYLYESFEPKGEDLHCRRGLRRAVCAQVFPECLDEGKSSSGAAYYQPCRAQCDQLKTCGFEYDNLCADLPTDNCFILVAPGYFVLNPDKGPYQYLPVMYGVIVGVWVVFAVLWNYLVHHVYKDSGALLCRAVAGLPLIKIVSVSIGISFWATCEKWGMCSFWLSVAYENTNLIFDTCLLGCFMLVGKGWSISRQVVPPQEWRMVLILMSTFYLATSINLVLEASVYGTQGFWIANVVVYGLVYINIVWSTIDQIKLIKVQIEPFKSAQLSREIVGPLKMKFRMYILFLVLIGAFMATEVLTHSLLFNDDRLWIAFTFFEISQIVLVAIIGFYFRPREFSPFFFMVPTTMNDQRARPTPIVEVNIDKSLGMEPNDGGEVDVSPLLRQTRTQGPPPSTMIFLKQPDGNIQMGVQSKSRSVVKEAARAIGAAANGSSRSLVEHISFVDLAVGNSIMHANGAAVLQASGRPQRSREEFSNRSGNSAMGSEVLEMRNMNNSNISR